MHKVPAGAQVQSLRQSQEERRETSSSTECHGANALMLGVPCSLTWVSTQRFPGQKQESEKTHPCTE